MTENVVLTTAGTFIGVVLSYWATRAMLALVPGSLPRADDTTIDWRVLSASAAVAAVGGVSFGLAASWSIRRSSLAVALHTGDGRGKGADHDSRRRGRSVPVRVSASRHGLHFRPQNLTSRFSAARPVWLRREDAFD